jgi:phenylalanyl-tRNA synthetase beta chain
MKISVNWLKELFPFKWTEQQLADKLGALGFPIESLTHTGMNTDNVVAARILSVDKHPNADRLQIAKVHDGKGERQIVCGAPNIAPGQVVPLALPGAIVKGGLEIVVSKIRGIESSGMLCSERELGLSESHAGIMQLSPNAPLGKEVREILGGSDTVIDIEVTPNRPDVLSHVGVARELAAVSGTAIKYPKTAWKTGAGDPCKIKVQEPQLCHRYMGKIFTDVVVGPSPKWMQDRLNACGIRAINNIVDITNYVLLEWGHPLHAFDLSKLANKEIIVRKAFDKERFLALDEKTYELNEKDLVIADGEKAVAIAGIMGGQNSGVTIGTATILLESAVFDPVAVRKTSRRLGLKSESSIRFEKGTDAVTAEKASLRAAQLIMDLAGGKPAKAADVYPKKQKPVSIELKAERLESLIGQSFPSKTVEAILSRFELKPKKNKTGWHCVVPPHRKDMTQDVDLIEEIVRVTGYGAVPETLAPLATNQIPAQFLPLKTDPLVQTLKGAGLTETMTSSFCSLSRAAKFGVPETNLVTLLNSLDQSEAYMRPSIVLTLLGAVERNVSYQRDSVALFELGRSYELKGDTPRESRSIGLVWYGAARDKDVHEPARELTIYDLKGLLETAGLQLKTGKEKPFLHPHQNLDILFRGQSIGWAGLLHPSLAKEHGFRRPCLVAEWNLDTLYAKAPKAVHVKPLPRFPFVERDLAIVVGKNQSWAEIEKTVREAAGALLRGVSPFDVFAGGTMDPSQKSVAFRLTLQHDDHTLSEAEITEVLNSIKQALERHCGAHLR